MASAKGHILLQTSEVAKQLL